MRAAFLGMVSHELRAPLTSIKGSTAMVLGETRAFARAEMLQFFRIVDEQAERMSALIGDLLDAGRIEAGALSVEPEALRVADLVEGARTTFLTGGGRHRVALDLPPELPRVMADRERVGQVLNNLLGNAARHSPADSPIRIEAMHEGAHVAIAVADEGRGIAPERLSRLFRKYSEDGEGRLGVGLGLAICKGLVEAHGGRIRAESGGPDLGARFTFTLPAVDEAGAEAGRSGAPREENGRPRILVVDDDPQTLRLVRDALTGAGYDPLVTGEHEGLGQVLAREKPALVLLDFMLPGADGVELMERLPGLSDVPVIFISGYGRDETVARALEAGAEDYVVKPFSPTELVARVRAALRRRAEPAPFVLGELAIDYDRRRVSVGGPRGRAHGDGVRAFARSLARGGAGVRLRHPAAPGLERTRGQAGLAGLRQAAAQEARRRRPAACVHRQRVTGRLPHAPARRAAHALTAGSSAFPSQACRRESETTGQDAKAPTGHGEPVRFFLSS